MDGGTERVVRSVNDLGHSLGLKVVGEDETAASPTDWSSWVSTIFAGLPGTAAVGAATGDWLRAESVETAAEEGVCDQNPR